MVGRYRLEKFLGQGSYGKVWKAFHSVTGEEVALKFISKAQLGSLADAERVKTEINCLDNLRHPHVIRLLEVISSDANIVLVFEFAHGGDLRNAVRSKGYFSEAEACKLFLQMVSGVTYCHRHNIVHHDLKLENILLDSAGNVKIADFGLSCVYKPGSRSRSTAGSLAYIAPEVLNTESSAGPPRDAWALGVILYSMVVGALPFPTTDQKSLMKAISAGKYSFPSDRNVTPAFRDVVSRMLTVDPNRRSTILSLQTHPWVQQFQINSPTRVLARSSTSGRSSKRQDPKYAAEYKRSDSPNVDARIAKGPDSTAQTPPGGKPKQHTADNLMERYRNTRKRLLNVNQAGGLAAVLGGREESPSRTPSPGPHPGSYTPTEASGSSNNRSHGSLGSSTLRVGSGSLDDMVIGTASLAKLRKSHSGPDTRPNSARESSPPPRPDASPPPPSSNPLLVPSPSPSPPSMSPRSRAKRRWDAIRDFGKSLADVSIAEGTTAETEEEASTPKHPGSDEEGDEGVLATEGGTAAQPPALQNQEGNHSTLPNGEQAKHAAGSGEPLASDGRGGNHSEEARCEGGNGTGDGEGSASHQPLRRSVSQPNYASESLQVSAREGSASPAHPPSSAPQDTFDFEPQEEEILRGGLSRPVGQRRSTRRFTSSTIAQLGTPTRSVSESTLAQTHEGQHESDSDDSSDDDAAVGSFIRESEKPSPGGGGGVRVPPRGRSWSKAELLVSPDLRFRQGGLWGNGWGTGGVVAEEKPQSTPPSEPPAPPPAKPPPPKATPAAETQPSIVSSHSAASSVEEVEATITAYGDARVIMETVDATTVHEAFLPPPDAQEDNQDRGLSRSPRRSPPPPPLNVPAGGFGTVRGRSTTTSPPQNAVASLPSSALPPQPNHPPVMTGSTRGSPASSRSTITPTSPPPQNFRSNGTEGPETPSRQPPPPARLSRRSSGRDVLAAVIAGGSPGSVPSPASTVTPGSFDGPSDGTWGVYAGQGIASPAKAAQYASKKLDLEGDSENAEQSSPLPPRRGRKNLKKRSSSKKGRVKKKGSKGSLKKHPSKPSPKNAGRRSSAEASPASDTEGVLPDPAAPPTLMLPAPQALTDKSDAAMNKSAAAEGRPMSGADSTTAGSPKAAPAVLALMSQSAAAGTGLVRSNSFTYDPLAPHTPRGVEPSSSSARLSVAVQSPNGLPASGRPRSLTATAIASPYRLASPSPLTRSPLITMSSPSYPSDFEDDTFRPRVDSSPVLSPTSTTYRHVGVGSPSFPGVTYIEDDRATPVRRLSGRPQLQ